MLPEKHLEKKQLLLGTQDYAFSTIDLHVINQFSNNIDKLSSKQVPRSQHHEKFSAILK